MGANNTCCSARRGKAERVHGADESRVLFSPRREGGREEQQSKPQRVQNLSAEGESGPRRSPPKSRVKTGSGRKKGGKMANKARLHKKLENLGGGLGIGVREGVVAQPKTGSHPKRFKWQVKSARPNTHAAADRSGGVIRADDTSIFVKEVTMLRVCFL